MFVESLGLLLNADGAPCEGSGKGQTDEGGERSDGNRGGDAGPDGYEIDRLEGGPVGENDFRRGLVAVGVGVVGSGDVVKRVARSVRSVDQIDVPWLRRHRNDVDPVDVVPVVTLVADELLGRVGIRTFGRLYKSRHQRKTRDLVHQQQHQKTAADANVGPFMGFQWAHRQKILGLMCRCGFVSSHDGGDEDNDDDDDDKDDERDETSYYRYNDDDDTSISVQWDSYSCMPCQHRPYTCT